MSLAARASIPEPSAPTAMRTPVGRPVRTPKTAELIARSLRRQIVRGELAPDEALPSESALMEEFGVSRPTLREAYRVLESEGLITVRRGARGGARVSAPDPEVAARYVGLVLEYRRTTAGDVRDGAAMLAGACVRSLAERRKAADLRRLEKALAVEQEALTDPAACAAAQEDFHALVVELTGNQTMDLLIGMVHSVLTSCAGECTASTPARLRKAHRAHSRLVELIADRDAEEAEHLWSRHLVGGEDTVKPADAKAVLDLMD
ncbi:FadR/GntR family transcriptional regulator [Streptomyces sp. NPDC058247]|uniref:FadR/GntR family transcriptional regulator n=1 Tax=Streptomyces sp. NPDC058247 TaxID=3346401 RepID=UPI0036EF4381